MKREKWIFGYSGSRAISLYSPILHSFCSGHLSTFELQWRVCMYVLYTILTTTPPELEIWTRKQHHSKALDQENTAINSSLPSIVAQGRICTTICCIMQSSRPINMVICSRLGQKNGDTYVSYGCVFCRYAPLIHVRSNTPWSCQSIIITYF